VNMGVFIFYRKRGGFGWEKISFFSRNYRKNEEFLGKICLFLVIF